MAEEKEEQPINEENSQEESTANEKNSQEESIANEENSQEEATKNEIKPDEAEDKNSDTNDLQTKQTKLQKILIITVGVLGAILLLGIILYFFGVFDPPPAQNSDLNNTKDANVSLKPKKYIFKIEDINKQRLNKRLKLLTKYEILGTAKEELEKEIQKNKQES
jgi:hypothetical protein